jgi:hypothetical protein
MKIQYKNYELMLYPNLEENIISLLQTYKPIHIIVLFIKKSNNEESIPNKFFKLANIIRHLFFAINPAYKDYEKIKLFFEFSNNILDDIPIQLVNTFEQIEISIYHLLYNLKKIAYSIE